MGIENRVKALFRILMFALLALNCRAAIVPIQETVFTTNTFDTDIVGGAIPYFDFPSGKFVASPTAYSNALFYDPALGFLSIVHTNDTGDLLLNLAVAGAAGQSIQAYADKLVVANTNLTFDAVGPFSIRLRINGSNVLEAVAGSISLSGQTNLVADNGSYLTYNGVAIATTITNSFGIHLDGGGLVLATGLAGYSTIVNGGTIQSCVMLADQTGSAIVDIWRCTYGQFDAGSTHPVAGDKITATAPPTIISALKSTNALTGWNLSVTNGDVIAWSVTACTNITKLDISVTTTR